MPQWRGSTRHDTLPKGWSKLRQRVFERDGFQCTATTIDGSRCTVTTNLQCDHVGDRLDNSMENLRSLCEWHHLRRSGRQGGQGAAAARHRRLRASNNHRPPEVHPGLLSPGDGPPWLQRGR